MKLLVLIAVLLFSGLVCAQEPVLMTMGYWLDDGDAPIEQATQAKYTPSVNKFSLLTTKSVSWIKIRLTNHSTTDQVKFLHNNTPFFSHGFKSYLFSNGQLVEEDSYSFSDAAVAKQLYGSTIVHEIQLKPLETKVLYLRNHPLYAHIFNFELHDKKSSVQALVNKNLFPNILIAILLSLGLYNLSLYFFGEGKELFYYSLYLINASIGLMYMYGTVYHNFNVYGDATHYLNITAILVPFFLSLFIKTTLNTQKIDKKIDTMLNAVIVMSVLDVILVFVIGIHLAMYISWLVFFSSFAVVVYLCIQFYKGRHPLINVFIGAYSVYIFGMSSTLMCIWGVIEFNNFNYYASGVCLVIEAMLFSNLLRYRTILLEEEVLIQKENGVRLNYLANHDQLTGLPNRRLFFEIAQVLLKKSQRDNRKFSILFLDLDGFKTVNDEHGHQAGDELLKQLAVRIEKKLRSSDLIARVGGDEFVVLLPDITDRQSVETIAATLIAMFQAPFVLDKVTVSVQGSIGISFYPEHSNNINALLDMADSAMYEVKQGGKNNWAVHE